MKLIRFVHLTLLIFEGIFAAAQNVNYSVTSVPEETGYEFVKISRPGDYVALPRVTRSTNGVGWYTNRILDINPNGETLAYLSNRSGATNIFIKDISRQGASMQRTNRSTVVDFSFSPDGKQIAFSEKRGNAHNIFITDAFSGYVCRQVTTAEHDHSPMFSDDMGKLFFCREELKGYSVWSYDFSHNFISSYTSGLTPAPDKGTAHLYISRINAEGHAEIWRIKTETGIEECVVSDPAHSFFSPVVSPDGKWLLMTGDGHISMPNGVTYHNVDIFVCRADGTDLRQLTYHAADDLSPAWGADGNHIYFISQRGDTDGQANIWRMSFSH